MNKFNFDTAKVSAEAINSVTRNLAGIYLLKVAKYVQS